MAKFEIDMHDKKIIGQLLRFYRINMNRAQKDMIINEYGDQICSRKTLSLIERGKPIALDRIYEELLLKFSLRYNYDKHIYEWKNKFSELLHYCEFYNIPDILQAVNSLMEIFERYKDYVIFHEIYYFCTIIQAYYQNHILLDENSVRNLSEMIKILNTPLNDIMIDLLFKSCVRLDLEYKEYYNFSKATNIINKMNYLMTLVYDTKVHSAIEYSFILKYELSSTDNHIRLLDLYNIKMTLYKKAEEQEFLSLVNVIQDILNTDDDHIPKIKRAQTYKNLAITAYKLELLDIAETGIIKFLQYDKRETIPYITILIDIYQRSDKFLAIIDIMTYQKPEICGNKYNVYLNYFIYKYKCLYAPEKLNDYIMRDVLVNLHKTDSIYVRIFYRELNSIIKITKRYKDSKTFIEKIKDLPDFQN